MGSSEFNQAIQAADWFNVADFSEATFSSQQLQSATPESDKTAFIARGILQLKGLQKNIAVPLSWHNNSSDRATITGELTLDRSDFAIGTGEWASGDQIGLAVRVWFTVQLDKIND
jgi:polyisoprenoid-binding protein YceI